jgi:hypothetical protein
MKSLKIAKLKSEAVNRKKKDQNRKGQNDKE